MKNPDCKKCHCNGCSNFCYKTCKSHSCLVVETKKVKWNILCRKLIIKEVVNFT